MNLKYKMENKTKWDKRAQDKFEVGKRIIPGVFNRCVEQFRFFFPKQIQKGLWVQYHMSTYLNLMSALSSAQWKVKSWLLLQKMLISKCDLSFLTDETCKKFGSALGAR